ncbi:MAG TPA: hypothetical protein VNT75_24270 [Symbiobacteriaceae bacterium]|nr:hypothetical protein [Symbiobacteriaceae bacterium]
MTDKGLPDVAAFEIGVAESECENRMRLRGRAWLEVHLGDLLYTDQDGPRGAQHAFIIERITTYGRNVDVLPEIWTGDIVVTGTDCSRLNGVRYLFKP